MKIKLNKILPNPEQPRAMVDQAEIESLAESLVTDGLLNPIAVEGPYDDGSYILLDGERRWRAAKLAGWMEIEANVRQPNGKVRDRLLLAMVGNLQRSDMGVIDTARGYQKLRERGYSVEEIAMRVGRSSSHIHSRLRMLEFPEPVRDLFNSGRIPLDEYTLVAFRRLPEDILIKVAQTAAERGYNSRQIQSLIARIGRVHGKKIKVSRPKILSQGSICPALDFNPELSKSWSWVRGAAKQTCQACGLYADGAMNTICRECPLTVFVGKIAQGYKSEEKKP